MHEEIPSPWLVSPVPPPIPLSSLDLLLASPIEHVAYCSILHRLATAVWLLLRVS